MPQQVRLLVGTRKGAFIYTADSARRDWTVSPPIMPGWSVYQLSADTRRDTPRIYAAANHWAWGRSVARSDDGGATWEQRSPGLSFAADTGLSVGNVWHVQPGLPSQPGVVFAGTQPAGLFRSEDWGESWAPVESLNRHPYRAFWGPTGGGDSSLHSIEIDPRDAATMYIAVSSGGSYVTRDGGSTWALCSHGAVATTPAARAFIKEIQDLIPPNLPPDVDPAAADEMHKMRIDTTYPDRLWGQTHIGVFRSDDGARTWHDVTAGLPSFHGFPIAVARQTPDTAYVVPLEYGPTNFRVCNGQFAVWRTRDAGASWQPLTEGLPGPDDYQSAYRDALDTDGLDPEGVYVGTSNGELYASANGGDRWQRLPGTLPPILGVTAAAW